MPSIGILVSALIPFTALLHAEQCQLPLQSPAHRVAIIGAGAGGASAAYHLQQFSATAKPSRPIDITIYEANSRVGGRTTTVNALDDDRYPTEVGGSIFVKVNHILYNASQDFGLTSKVKDPASSGSAYDLGIWDGQEFVFTIANEAENSPANSWKDWWDIAKLLWKYGLSPIKTQRLTKSTVGKFLDMYDKYFPFTSLDDVVVATGLDEVVSFSGKDFLSQGGISEQFAREIIQSSTRVNYAQNLDIIHGLETMVCMAIEGAMAVEGGNWQIFDEFVKRSGADLQLNTAITDVGRSDNGQWYVRTNTSGTRSEFDTVILAAPYQFANVTFNPPLRHVPKAVDYVRLHVTLFTSPRRPSPAYFGLSSQDEVPDSVLTTLEPNFNPHESRGKDAVGPTKFWSLSTLRILDPEPDQVDGSSSSSQQETAHPTQRIPGRQYLYKIFSPEPVTAALLSDMFNLNHTSGTAASEPISVLPKDLITWSHIKTWNSYPYLPPVTLTSQGRPQEKGEDDGFPPIILDDNVYYTSSIEPFISTMETSALSGRNVARLIVDSLLSQKYPR